MDLNLASIAAALGGEISGGQVLAPGPGHSCRDRSLAVKLNDKGDLVVHSFAGDDPIVCKDYVRQACGRPPWEPGQSNGKDRERISVTPRRDPRRIAKTYDYRDADGALIYQVVRYEPKGFSQRRPVPGEAGKWIWGLKEGTYLRGQNGDFYSTNEKRLREWKDAERRTFAGTQLVPYRLSELLAADPDATVYVVEGEKDADRAASLGLIATTNSEGAGKWTPDLNKYFAGKNCIIVPDNDLPGEKHGHQVAGHLHGVAKNVRILDLPGQGPQLPHHGLDLSDWLDRDNTAEQLSILADQAPPWRLPPSNKNSWQEHTKPSPRVTGTWDDPDWTMLDDRRGDLPEFPVDVLPTRCRKWLERSARGAGVTPGHVAVPLFSIVSSLIGAARRVRPSLSWSEPMTLWTAVVGFSGSGKTPGLDVTKRALSRIERDRKGKIAELQRAHETRSEAAKAAREKWKGDVKAAVDGGTPPPLKPADAVDPGPFIPPRLYVSDATIERLAVLLQARPRGMLFIADELAGVFLNMSRYSNGQDNEFWLEAWNGKHFVVERMSRPPVVVDHLLIGITGGFQPDKLARSFAGDNDGMYARVMYGWPEEPGYHKLSNDVAEEEPEILHALTRVVDLPAGEDGIFAPKEIWLSHDAIEAFEQFRQFLDAGKAQLDGREREWWAKGGAHVLRLVGTLFYLAWAMGTDAEPSCIEVQFVQAAVRLWRDYFWPHSRAAMRQIGLSERHANARRVLRWLRAHRKAEVSLTDIRRDALAQSLDAGQTGELLDGLARAGWLCKDTTKTGERGRPAVRWQVNPKLFGHAENAENAENH
jgi:hypothetical protein